MNPSLYSSRPEWDHCSPTEYYKWTEGWDWNEEFGHRPTQEMANDEWDKAPEMSNYPHITIAQYMNQATRDITVTSEREDVNKKRQQREPTHQRNRPRPNQWSPSWARNFSPHYHHSRFPFNPTSRRPSIVPDFTGRTRY
jgi:hypothetical protein